MISTGPTRLAAAEAGKHILVEKPMALSVSDAKAMIDAADRNGVVLAVNHHLPGSPLHATARRLVAEGRIGTLHSARINHAVLLPEHLRGWRLSSSPGGRRRPRHHRPRRFGTQPAVRHPTAARHRTRYLPGRLEHRQVNDSVMTIIEYAPGDHGVPGLAQTHDAFTDPYPGTSLEIHGETGAIVIGDAMTQDTSGTITLHTDDGINPSTSTAARTSTRSSCAAFVRHRGDRPTHRERG